MKKPRTRIKLITALKIEVREVPEALVQQDINKSGRSGRTCLFRDVIKSVWILEIMVVCDSVQQSSGVPGWYGMMKASQHSHLNDHPRL